MSYYDNITLGGLGNQETTGSNSEISWGKPIMGSFQSRLENTPELGFSSIYVPLKINLPRPPNSTQANSNFDFPYNCIRLNAIIFNKGEIGGDDSSPIYVDQEFYFSLAQGTVADAALPMTNFSFVNNTLYEGILDSNVNSSNEEIILFGGSTLLFDGSNVASIVISYQTSAVSNSVTFIKGLYLLI
jgi:hypothetical protein